MAFGQLIGEVLDGKYRIERQLGEGGMGAVYLATHVGTERLVALKVIAPQFMKHDEFVERFKREARAAGRLRHPNVVDVTDFGFAAVGTQRVAYLVMEYLDGCTLDEVLAEESQLPLGWVLDIIEQTCSAVHEAHQRGIVHRDLKPDNIWLEPNHRGGYTIKVLDFGIAKLDNPLLSNAPGEVSSAPPSEHAAPSLEAATLILDAPAARELASEATTQIFDSPPGSSEAGTQILPARVADEERTRLFEGVSTDGRSVSATEPASGSLTRVGSLLGTPLYMSPEQCRGEALDLRADVYSLGVIAYRMLAGHTPFSGDLQTVILAHLNEAPPPLSVKHVPKKVSRLVMSALAKNPAERPQTAAALAGAVRAHSSGALVLIQRAMTLYLEHLPTFLRLALLVYAPMVVATLISFTVNLLNHQKAIPAPWSEIASACASLLVFLVGLVTGSVMVGVTTWLVTQLLAIPLRPLKLRPAFVALRKRLRPFLATSMLLNLMVIIGLVLCVFPGVIMLLFFALTGSVLMMEDLSGKAALKRSIELTRRSLRTVLAIVTMHLVVPIAVSATLAVVLVGLVKAVFKTTHADIWGMSFQILSLPTTILFSSLASVVSALLYWKTRLAGGESIREGFSRFETLDTQSSKWQLRMRERVSTSTRTSHRT